jgi:flagellar protein FlaG
MGVNEVEVSNVEVRNAGMRDAVASAPAAVNAVSAPKQATESFNAEKTSGGNGTQFSRAQVEQMVTQMQGHIDSMNVSLQYSLYGKHDEKIAIKVVDKGTGDVIREFPPKELQALQAKMSELCGLIFNRDI